VKPRFWREMKGTKELTTMALIRSKHFFFFNLY